MSQKRLNRTYVLSCNFPSGWNFDMGSSNGVSQRPHVIIYIKFGDDRMRNNQVIMQISQKWAVFAGNQ